MSDWELVSDSQSSKSVPASDWEVITPNQVKPSMNESLTSSAIKAPFRIGEDVIRGGYNFIKNIPNYYQSSKTEIPGLLNTLFNNPAHLGAQGLAGLTELGHGVLNMPHALAEYGANRLNLLPQNFPEKIPYQRDISQEINQAFGQPNLPGDELMRGLVRNLPNIGGSKLIGSKINPLNFTAKNIAKDILKTGEANQKLYSSKYDKLFQEAKNKGYSDLSLVKPDIDIKTLKKYSPPKSIEGVEDFLNDPTIENAHKAKSDLLRIQRKLNKETTFNTAQGKQFNAVNNSIENIQNSMFKTTEGKIDKKLLDKYSKIQKGYAEEVIPYKNESINAFKRREITPTQLVDSLSKGEFMVKRGKYHPELKLRNSIPGLKTAGISGLGGILGASGYHYLMDEKSNE